MTDTNYSLSDIAAATGNGGNNGGWGNGGWSEWILVFLIFAIFGNNWGGGFGFGGSQGAMDNYVLTSDFSQLSRQISDTYGMTERKLDGISNGICSLGYDQLAQMNGINQNIAQNGYETRFAIHDLSTQLADCCCKTQQNIKDVQYGIATESGNIQYAIKDCCCENEKIAMQNRFDMAQYNCNTLQAIDKVGDRIIDYLANDKAQALRDENQALRLAASQSAQNNYLLSQLRPCPNPAYIVPNPNCCYGNSFGYGTTCGA